MNKLISTTVCCLCFAIGGFLIAATNGAFSYNKTAKAAPIIMQYPKDLLLGHTNNVGLKIWRDTIRDTVPLEIRYDTITKVKYKYKTKWRIKKLTNPDTVASRVKNDIDTLYVSKPVLVIPAVKEEAVDSIL